MSRSRYWTYTLGVEQAHETYWWSFFYQCPLPVKYVPSGGCDFDRATILLYANKTKARRLKTWLDRWFGEDGHMEESI